MDGEITPVAQRIKPTKKSVLVLNQFSAFYASSLKYGRARRHTSKQEFL
jgi:hypothetical protein